MGSYRFSVAATGQIERLLDYSLDRFGIVQTEAYASGLKKTFALLAEFPGLGAKAFSIEPGLWRYVYQSHFVFYVPKPDHIFIRAVIHGRRKVRRTDLDD